MRELTHGNHFKFGYLGRDWYEPRAGASDSWTVRYGQSRRQPRSWREECVETARLIRGSTDLPMVVLFSGGMDSEIVVRSFVEAKIPIRCAISRFADGLNKHDIEYAMTACEQLGVPYDVHKLDLLGFWDGPVDEYCDRTRSFSPQLAATMWLVDQVDGFPVMGSGECYLVKDMRESERGTYPRSAWYMWEKERTAAWYRHFIERDREGCPGFFQYTPEVMHSFLVDPAVRALADDQVHGKLSSLSSKNDICYKHWPEMRFREKYTGFEMVQSQDRVTRERLKQRWGHCDGVAKTEYHELVNSTSFHLGKTDDEKLADAFISSHIGWFGINGSNTQRELGTVPGMSRATTQFTKTDHTEGNHFSWGYDNLRFNRRSASTSVFWAGYERQPGHVSSLPAEMVKTFRRLSDEHGRIAIHYTGSVQSFACLTAARVAGVAHTVFSLDCESVMPLVPDVGQERHPVELETLERFTWEDFSTKGQCSDPEVAFYAMASRFAEGTCVYDGPAVRLVDHNFDQQQGHSVGRPNWALLDNERNHAIPRYLDALGMKGICFPFKHTPEIAAALLRTQRHEHLVGLRNNAKLEIKALSNIWGVPDWNYWDYWTTPFSHDPAYLSEHRLALVGRVGRCSTSWSTPMEWVARWFGLEGWEDYRGPEEYGSVVPDR